jgi:hypothetical protein
MPDIEQGFTKSRFMARTDFGAAEEILCYDVYVHVRNGMQ